MPTTLRDYVYHRHETDANILNVSFVPTRPYTLKRRKSREVINGLVVQNSSRRHDAISTDRPCLPQSAEIFFLTSPSNPRIAITSKAFIVSVGAEELLAHIPAIYVSLHLLLSNNHIRSLSHGARSQMLLLLRDTPRLRVHQMKS